MKTIEDKIQLQKVIIIDRTIVKIDHPFGIGAFRLEIA
jgi:hypothetical protein